MRGRLDIDELRNEASDGTIDTVIVAFADLYGRLAGKRFDVDFFLDEGAVGGTHACDYLLASDIDLEPVPGYDFTNWDKGYGDVHLVPDLTTLRRAAWLDRTAIVLCDVADHRDESVAIAPRSLLWTQRRALADRGFEAQAASELEYYLYDSTYREAAADPGRGHRPAGWDLEDYQLLQPLREEPFTATARRALRDSGVPVETSKGEWGLGQHELNIRYAEVGEMADRHGLFKQCLKDVAELQDRSVTFMAKPHDGRAGSSCHLHLSLWHLPSTAAPGKPSPAFASGGGAEPTDVFRWFLGGWLAGVAELMPFYAPTVNSYKRYEDGSWAPTRLAWSHDNRTAVFRVVGSGPSLRIECRLPGADCNPYLAFAAALASGLHGIDERLEPPPAFLGDVYAARELPLVPRSLGQATDAFERSDLARTAFGDEVVDHYVHFFRTEQAAFDRSVTDWERRRYFERI